MFELIVGNKKKIFKFFNFLLLISFIWIIFINTSYFFEKIIFGSHEHFFDLKLIHNSFIETLNGKNTYEIYPPYYDQPTTSLPPHFLLIFKDFGNIDWLIFVKYFIFLQILSYILLFYYSYKLFPLSKIKYLYPFMYFFGFNFSLGLGGTVVGNIAIILYSIVSLAIVCLFKKKILTFNFLIFIATLFKFYFLLFYFLPVFVYGIKYLKSIFIFISLLILINFISYINNPELFQSWIDLLEIQTARNSYNPWIGSDITQAFASVIWKIGTYFDINIYPKSWISNFFYFTITGIIFSSIFFIYNPKYRNTRNLDENLTILSFGLLTIFLLYPRLMIYDFFLIIPVYYFLVIKIKFFENENKNFFTKFTLLFIFLCVQDTHSGLCSFALLFFLILYAEYDKRNPLKLMR